MKYTRIMNAINNLRSDVADLKKMIFGPNTGRFLFLSRSIQRQFALIQNRCNTCSSICEHDYVDHYVMIVQREMQDIQELVFDHKIHTDELIETEDDIHTCFEQIELNIGYMEYLFLQPEMFNLEVL